MKGTAQLGGAFHRGRKGSSMTYTFKISEDTLVDALEDVGIFVESFLKNSIPPGGFNQALIRDMILSSKS